MTEKPFVLCFHYEAMDGDSETLIHVLLERPLNAGQLHALEDSISSYIDSIPAWNFEQLIHNALDAAGIGHTLLMPDYTFHI